MYTNIPSTALCSDLARVPRLVSAWVALWGLLVLPALLVVVFFRLYSVAILGQFAKKEKSRRPAPRGDTPAHDVGVGIDRAPRRPSC